MLSSSGLKSDVQRSGESGISAYLSKPVARDELMQVLARVLKLDSQRGVAQVVQQSVQERSRSLNVLLVEDHAINQKLAVALLERWGHRVTVADNGQIALDQFDRQKFDVVLMDMMMPVMDGLEATRAIRSRESARRTPIIAMTANAMEADRDRCIEAGMDDYLSKPIKAQELQSMLARYADAVTVPAVLAAVASAPAAAVFDYVAALAAADQEIVGIIAEAFVEQWPVDLEKIRKALARGDCKVVLHTSHALKGTLSMFGARPASELAARIEAAAAREDQPSIAQWLTPLQEQVEPLLAAIQACLAPGP
jgi:CheY-like chemotaxis protein